MKKRHLILFAACLVAMASLFVTISTGEQNEKYIAEQENKQFFLISMMEDVVALRSCLQPSYHSSLHSSDKSGIITTVPSSNITVVSKKKK